MSVEDAAKVVISAGLVYPGEKDEDMPAGVDELAGKIVQQPRDK